MLQGWVWGRSEREADKHGGSARILLRPCTAYTPQPHRDGPSGVSLTLPPTPANPEQPWAQEATWGLLLL